VQLTASQIDVLISHKDGSDAALLYLKLRRANGDRAGAFAVSPKAMAAAQVIPGWAHGRYRRARDVLTEIRLLSVVHEGGQGAGDPRLFIFETSMTKGPAT
jgi:hypothetical protein